MSKLKIQTTALRHALAKVGPAIRPDNVLPALRNVHCATKSDSLEITGTDGEMVVVQCLPVEIEDKKEASFLLPPKFMGDILALVEDEFIGMQVMATKVKVITSTDVYEIKCPNVNTYPKPWEFPNGCTVELIEEAGREMIVAINGAAVLTRKPDSDGNKSIMSWVKLEIADKTAKVVATDGAFGIHTQTLSHSFIGPDKDLFIPVRAVKPLRGLGLCKIGWDDTRLGFDFNSETGNTKMMVVQPQGRYPQYKAMMPDLDPNFSLPKHLLVAALEKCCMTEPHFGEATFILKQYQPAQLHAQDNSLGISTSTDLNVTFNGEAMEVTVGGRMMLSMLKQVDGVTIDMAMQGANKAILIKCPEVPGYHGLINTNYQHKKK